MPVAKEFEFGDVLGSRGFRKANISSLNMFESLRLWCRPHGADFWCFNVATVAARIFSHPREGILMDSADILRYQ